MLEHATFSTTFRIFEFYYARFRHENLKKNGNTYDKNK